MTDMANGIGDSSNNMNSRQSASPARTIDSRDSTNGSMDTIVDRGSLNREQLFEQSTNTTNAQQLLQQHDSLTNSEAAMLQLSSSSASDEEHQQQPVALSQPNNTNSTATATKAATAAHNATTLAQQQQQQQQQQLDAQSHIYSSPVYDEKPPLKLTAATLLATTASTAAAAAPGCDGAGKQQPKLITHKEFQRQLQEVVASRANTLDSRISKKQRFPPELIKIKDGAGDGGSSSASSARSSKAKRSRRTMPSSACCSAFPLQIVLGSLQLLLAVSLVALGSLLIVRDAALATAGCGIWTGLISAVTGSLGVVSMRKTQTAFLALSLVCIATSTLALAISGVGLSRDVNHMAEKLDLLKSRSVISAAGGLIFTLFLHFIVSIVSVYRCALQICSRLFEYICSCFVDWLLGL